MGELSFLAILLGGIVLLLLLLYILYRIFLRYFILKLPLKGMGLDHAPAYPFKLVRILKALTNLSARSKAVKQAKNGLTSTLVINNHEASAYAFCYAKNNEEQKESAINQVRQILFFSPLVLLHSSLAVKLALNKLPQQGQRSLKEYKDAQRTYYNLDKGAVDMIDLTILPLDRSEQYALSWTNFGDISDRATKTVLPIWKKSLTDAEAATNQFFPTIATHGVAYNLMILKKLSAENVTSYKNDYSRFWTQEMDNLLAAEQLFIIDFRIFNELEPQLIDAEHDIWRFTPSTFTWLKQDPTTKAITPFAVHIDSNGTSDISNKEYTIGNAQFYDIRTTHPSTWIYALQTVKVSTTVFGIWLGHVYPWHLVTAAMAMTMFNRMKKNHLVHKLLAPQCENLIGFNDALALLWRQAAPPTSITTAYQFLEIVDKYAKGRNFFDDDPKNTLANFGLKKEDFTIEKDWDQYPIVGYMLEVWDIVEKYADGFVKVAYKTDEEVKKDKFLKNWMAKSTSRGNIKGLPKMDSKTNLQQVLTSFIYRLTIHGLSRLDNTANPAMTFVANFPPCLQKTDIPTPDTIISEKELLTYLPYTGTIGRMVDFYFTFSDSAPYQPLIPVDGIEQNSFFEEPDFEKEEKKKKKRSKAEQQKIEELNEVLFTFRKDMIAFIDAYTKINKIPDLPPNPPMIHQWPMSVET